MGWETAEAGRDLVAAGWAMAEDVGKEMEVGREWAGDYRSLRRCMIALQRATHVTYTSSSSNQKGLQKRGGALAFVDSIVGSKVSYWLER